MFFFFRKKKTDAIPRNNTTNDIRLKPDQCVKKPQSNQSQEPSDLRAQSTQTHC